MHLLFENADRLPASASELDRDRQLAYNVLDRAISEYQPVEGLKFRRLHLSVVVPEGVETLCSWSNINIRN